MEGVSTISLEVRPGHRILQDVKALVVGRSRLVNFRGQRYGQFFIRASIFQTFFEEIFQIGLPAPSEPHFHMQINFFQIYTLNVPKQSTSTNIKTTSRTKTGTNQELTENKPRSHPLFSLSFFGDTTYPFLSLAFLEIY